MIVYVLMGMAAYVLAVVVLSVVMPWLVEQDRDAQRWRREQERARRPRETIRASFPLWIKNGIALIRSACATDITDSIISVQPMTNRNGRIHYMDVVTANFMDHWKPKMAKEGDPDKLAEAALEWAESVKAEHASL